MKKWKCVLCSRTCTGFGHNAEPVAKGKCCTICNDVKVLPYRLRLMRPPVAETIKGFIDAKKRWTEIKNAKVVR